MWVDYSEYGFIGQDGIYSLSYLLMQNNLKSFKSFVVHTIINAINNKSAKFLEIRSATNNT